MRNWKTRWPCDAFATLPSRSAQVDYLLSFADSDRNDYRVRAHAVTSLGRLVADLSDASYRDLRGRVAESYLRRGHEYVVLDLALFGEGSRPIAWIKHSAVIRPRKVE